VANVLEALRAGVAAYVMKDATTSELADLNVPGEYIRRTAVNRGPTGHR
jgi:hypothetical protein